jgi:hypothetical protein
MFSEIKIVYVVVAMMLVTIAPAYAQQQSQIIPFPGESQGAIDEDLQGLIDGIITECNQNGVPQCLRVDYGSPSVLVLSGPYYLPTGAQYYPNPFLWRAASLAVVIGGYNIASAEIVPHSTGEISNIRAYVVLTSPTL